MKIKISGVYKTQSGNYLRLTSHSELLYHFILVTKENVPIDDLKNKFGCVVVRAKRQYTEETFKSFKLVN